MSVNSEGGGLDRLVPRAKVRGKRSRSTTVPYGSFKGSDRSTPLLLESSFSSLDSSGSAFTQEFNYISTDMTAEAIRQCEKWILSPYSNALRAIGWLPYKNSRAGYIWQSILALLWFICIVATMVMQILSCFKRDTYVKSVDEDVEMSNQILNAQFALEENTTQAPLSPAFRDIHCEEHVISSFILLDIVVLVTYFYGVYLFARGETEYLFGLASHVFIKNSIAESSSKKLIRTIGALFIGGIFWLLFSLIVRVMTAVAVRLFEPIVRIIWADVVIADSLKITLVTFSLVGFFAFDILYMFSIMNYLAQAEMNIYLLWDVRKLVETRKYDHIDGAIKDIQKCKQYLDVLNGKTATLAALSTFVLGYLGIVSIIDLDNINSTKVIITTLPLEKLAASAAVLNAMCWCILAVLPFIQAARVTYWCDQLQDLGPEIRGKVSAAYADAELLDLESLLSFLQNIKLRAVLFGVPIYPWLLYLVLVGFSFTMLVLFQTDNYSIAKYI